RALRRDMLENVADNVRIFARRVGVNFLVAVWVRTNQFDLAVEAARNPVVINLIALSSALDVVSAILIMEVAILHPKHRAGMCEFIGSHIERVLPRPVAAVIDLDILKRQRTGVGVGAEDAMGRTIMN